MAPAPDGLDPDVAALLDELRARGEPAMFADVLDADGVDEARRRYADGLRATVRPVPRVPEVVEDPDDPAAVPLRLHRPAGGCSGATVVFVHGGGWTLGGGAAYDPVGARLAEDTGALVVAVDYRLAPDHPFPDPYDDVVDAVRRAVTERAPDPSRCALVGDSAGANLALGAALVLRDEGVPLAAQALVYPATDFEARYPSMTDNADGYWLTTQDVKTSSRLYLAGRDPRGDHRLSPLRAPTLAGLPPTVLALAGFDPLHDAGAALGEALAGAGVEVRVLENPGLVHGFLGFTAVVPAADAAVAALHAEIAGLLA